MIDPAKIRPLHDYVLIRRDEHDTLTKGGLIIPEIARTAAEGSRQRLRRGRGTVIAVGPGARKMKRVDLGHYRGRESPAGEYGERAIDLVPTDERIPVDLKPGDRVAFDILADLGDLDELGHPMLTLVHEERICGILEDNEERP